MATDTGSEDEGPWSPIIPYQNSARNTETPKRPSQNRKRYRPSELDSDHSEGEERMSGSIKEIKEIKSLVEILCKKVDGNERSLKELQAHSR